MTVQTLIDKHSMQLKNLTKQTNFLHKVYQHEERDTSDLIHLKAVLSQAQHILNQIKKEV